MNATREQRQKWIKTEDYISNYATIPRVSTTTIFIETTKLGKNSEESLPYRSFFPLCERKE